MFWRNKNKEPKVIHLQRFQPFFTTTDGKNHEGIDTYKWFNADRLLCSVPEFLMIDIKSDGYLEDRDNVMYPLQNVVSIVWKLIDQKIVLDNFYHEYQVAFSNKEVAEMTEYKEK